MDLFINLSLALLEGIGLIISPCILPVLPIILAAGITGGNKKPYGIMCGFIIAFCLFTLSARTLVIATGINLDIIRNVSFILLLLLAIVMMSSYLANKFSQATQSLASMGYKYSSNKQGKNGFISGMLIGFPIGLIWTPCAGPIIAAVVIQTIKATTNIETILTLIFFSIGVAIPMLMIIIFGKKIVSQSNFLQKHAENIRKILGAIIFVAVIINMQGSVYISSSKESLSDTQLNSTNLINGITFPYKAPEISGITAWINSSPLTMKELKGKVVLVDFWTYSCINCIRTLPYIKDWDQKYRDKGLVIIGVHSPEFFFEHSLDNVKNAVKKYGILYPVALDNDFITWDNYQNHYWPAHYLIDKKGNVVYTHFGEGKYAITEHNIQILLGEKKIANKNDMKSNDETISFSAITPETYLGSNRSTRFANKPSIFTDKAYFQYPIMLQQNYWALQGEWQIAPQKIISLKPDASLKIYFNAKKVFLVLGSSDHKPKTAEIFLNGKPIGEFSGADVHNNKLIITDETLYELVNLPKQGSGILEIRFKDPGSEAYAFTFG